MPHYDDSSFEFIVPGEDGARPAPGGFSFDYMVSMWDEPSHIWRATYSTARQCFDLRKLPFNPYDTSRKIQQDEEP